MSVTNWLIHQLHPVRLAFCLFRWASLILFRHTLWVFLCLPLHQLNYWSIIFFFLNLSQRISTCFYPDSTSSKPFKQVLCCLYALCSHVRRCAALSCWHNSVREQKSHEIIGTVGVCFRRSNTRPAIQRWISDPFVGRPGEDIWPD